MQTKEKLGSCLLLLKINKLRLESPMDMVSIVTIQRKQNFSGRFVCFRHKLYRSVQFDTDSLKTVYRSTIPHSKTAYLSYSDVISSGLVNFVFKSAKTSGYSTSPLRNLTSSKDDWWIGQFSVQPRQLHIEYLVNFSVSIFWYRLLFE